MPDAAAALRIEAAAIDLLAGMSEQDLYDATRSAWVVGKDGRERVKLACSVYEGVVREVYEVTGWLRGGSTLNARYNGRPA